MAEKISENAAGAGSKLTSAEADKLVMCAREARERAYVPYSGYRVGAALLTRSGKIFGGCNVENASYGLTLCAERTAMVSAVAAGEQDYRAIAVVTEDLGSPCGACRQFMVEFGPDIEVILADLKGNRMLKTTGELLPGYFAIKPEHRGEW